MLSDAALVKPLACFVRLWHRQNMEKQDNKSREARLAEALRANLRRRKVQDSSVRREKGEESSCPKSEG
jgi:hypothetical protein